MRRSVALLILIAAACATTRDEAGVRAAMSGFMEALNALDAERIATYFAEDATAFFPVVSAERVDGKAAVTDVFRNYAEATKKNVSRTNIQPEDLTVSMRGPMAVVTFNVHNPSAVSRRTFVFRREGGRWLIAHMHASNHALPR